MPLIDSPRLSDADRENWARQSAADAALADTAEHKRFVDAAIDRIEKWTAGGLGVRGVDMGRRGYVAVSWGKDSVVLADLACIACGWPLAWVRLDPISNPDCPAVRDEFLKKWPGVEYAEIAVECMRGSDGVTVSEAELYRAFDVGHDEAHRRFGPANMSGMRGEESAKRKKMQRGGSWATERRLAPLIDWPTSHIWAYAAANGLPLHPSYAMTGGGALDRDWQRVSTLTGEDGIGMGRREWERAAYPESRKWRKV